LIHQHIGIICGSENNLVVVASIHDSFIKMVEAYGAIILSVDEKNRLAGQVFDPDTRSLKRLIIGKSAQFSTEFAGIQRDKDIRLVIVPIRQDELQGPYGHEKLAPILSLYVVNDEAEGIQVCKHILTNQGHGHTAVIYT
jgi:acyl-CoA reductase-like NAD-dependent aldehyde dehydrogenase